MTFCTFLMKHILRSPVALEEEEEKENVSSNMKRATTISRTKVISRTSCASVAMGKSPLNTNITLSSANSLNDDGIIESTLFLDDNRFNFIKTPRARISAKKKCACECGKSNNNKGLFQKDPSPNDVLHKATKRDRNQFEEGQSSKSNSPDLLVPSKRRNVEKWLEENALDQVATPPFFNLSPRRKSLSRSRSAESLDDSVKEVLEAVYGDNWRDIQFKSKTDVKVNPPRQRVVSTSVKSNLKTAGSSVRKKASARRNIFDEVASAEGLQNISIGSGFHLLEGNDDIQESPYVDEKKAVRKTRKKNLAELSPENLPKEKNVPIATPKTPLAALKTPLNPSKNFVSETKTPRRTFLASLSVSSPSSISHPQAYEYKVNFKTKKDELLARLFKLFNQEVFEMKLPENMQITWNAKMRGTAGFCYNRKTTRSSGEIIRSSRIELATKIIDRADRLRDTLIHEMCHAAAWVVDGVLDGHGLMWQRWTDRAQARFPELPMIRRCHNYQIIGKFTYKCINCGYSIQRHSRSIDIARKRCGYCFGQLELLINKMKKGKTEVPEFDTTRTMRPPNNFALFVKENYNSVKEEHQLKKHGDIMKIISEQYRIYKSVATPSDQKKKAKKTS